MLATKEAPNNVQIYVNDDTKNIDIRWDYVTEEFQGEFKVYFNNEFTGAVSSDTEIRLAELRSGVEYEVAISAYLEGDESLLSDTVSFRIEAPQSSTDPNDWVAVRLDNVTVTYEK